jgi:hypothetical protein
MVAAEFHVRASPLRYAGLLVVSLLLALGGWMLLSEPDDWSDRLVGWLSVLFFGGGALLVGFLGARIFGKPLLSVGPMGIRVRLISPLAKAQEMFIPWEHITLLWSSILPRWWGERTRSLSLQLSSKTLRHSLPRRGFRALGSGLVLVS